MSSKQVSAKEFKCITQAQEILQKAKKDGFVYKEMKYVQEACNTAYNGVLLAINEYLRNKEGLEYLPPHNIDDYRNRLRKHSKTLFKLMNAVYQDLYLSGYYHGIASVKTVNNGLSYAKRIIKYVHNRKMI